MACPGGGMRCGVPRLTCFSKRATFAKDDEWGHGQKMLSGGEKGVCASPWALTTPDFLATLSGAVILCPLRFLHPPGLPLYPPSLGL